MASAGILAHDHGLIEHLRYVGPTSQGSTQAELPGCRLLQAETLMQRVLPGTYQVHAEPSRTLAAPLLAIVQGVLQAVAGGSLASRS